MDLGIALLHLDQTGIADVLQWPQPPAIGRKYEPSETIEFKLPEKIELSSTSKVHYLTIEEQRTFERARRRSVKIVHKARRNA